MVIYADKNSYEILKGNYPKICFPGHRRIVRDRISLAENVGENGFVVDEAIEHIHKYSSKHSEAIISEDAGRIEKFHKMVDASSVYSNVSTAFTDGAQFGLGAEIGISTQKLHARGPMALEELTSYKWIIEGSGQVRPK